MVYAPVNEGDIVGKAVFVSDGKIITELLLHAAESVELKHVAESPQQNSKNIFSILLNKIQGLFDFRGEIIGR